MGVAKRQTSGRKVRDFVTERTNSGSKKTGSTVPESAGVNLFSERTIRSQK
jgi:hypothetical protein